MADPILPITTVTNLPPVPRALYTDANGKENTDVHIWLTKLRNRVGGGSGNIIYDSADASQTTGAMEPQLFAMLGNMEAQLYSAILSIVEQIQENPTIAEPFDSNLGGFIQAALDNSLVSSVFGRTGAIVAQEGDYTLNLLGDVTITAPATNDVLKYNGSGWVNGTTPTPSLSSIAPNYETATATASQTVFNTTLSTLANSGGKSYLMVTCNGLVMDEGAGADYTVTGANQITFTSGRTSGDKITFRGWA